MQNNRYAPQCFTAIVAFYFLPKSVYKKKICIFFKGHRSIKNDLCKHHTGYLTTHAYPWLSLRKPQFQHLIVKKIQFMVNFLFEMAYCFFVPLLVHTIKYYGMIVIPHDILASIQ